MSLESIESGSYFGFVHRGARCLLSSDEVKAIHGQDAGRHARALWTGPNSEAAGRFLELRTGTQWLEVNDLKTIDAVEVEMLDVSRLLVGVLAQRHVVGIARVRGELHWLVGSV